MGRVSCSLQRVMGALLLLLLPALLGNDGQQPSSNTQRLATRAAMQQRQALTKDVEHVKCVVINELGAVWPPWMI